MKILVIVLLVAAVLLGVLGFLIKAALWLAFIGLALFIGTIVFWWVRSRIGNKAEIESP